ncbi:MAG: GIY-YIG nuclease family protein [Candidatus Omnitrophica bacterium]|nr:GIY-YIG nuclease family protein [Candidatus Omnitrophota bacterium]
MKQAYVYFMMNFANTVIYTGVTSDLKKRVYQHKNDLFPGFTSEYKVHKLVYFEMFEEMIEGIKREKQIKAGSRKKKLELIRERNPSFEDLYPKI